MIAVNDISRTGVDSGREFNLLDFGAVGDGKTLNTIAFQDAIDRCAESGGGKVIIPQGRFLTGGFVLKSSVNLHLEAGSEVLGSPYMRDYQPHSLLSECRYQKYLRYALVFAQGAKNLTISGPGTLNGNATLAGELGEIVGKGSTAGERPCLLWIDECENILIKEITYKNSCMWTETYSRCQNVHVDGVTVTQNYFYNADGCNMVDCRNFVIENCDINTMDDGICLKSYAKEGCVNGIIRNNRVRSICNGIKMGTDSTGGFRDIIIENNQIWQTNIAGLALETTDGGLLENILVRNIIMDVVATPVFVMLSNRNRKVYQELDVPQGALRNVHIKNLQATVDKPEKYNEAERAHFDFIPYASSISGYPDHYIDGLTLENINIEVRGGFPPGTAQDAIREIPEANRRYPASRMYGTLPAWGLYIRHVRDLKLRNVKLTCSQKDGRPGLMLADVHQSALQDLKFGSDDGAPLVSIGPSCSQLQIDLEP